MKRISWPAALAALGLVLASDALATAQGTYINPVNRPAVSPYINLLRRGNSAGVNYFGLVRPEVDAQANFANQQAMINSNQTAIGNLQNAQAGGPLVTGGYAGFQTHLSYFQNLSGGGGGGFGAASFGQFGGGGGGNLMGGARGGAGGAPGSGSFSPPPRRGR